MSRKSSTDSQPVNASCYDCGLAYGSPAWADVVVPDEIWRQICPTGGGLLCFNCMVRLLSELGLQNVPVLITSGPFAFCVREAADAKEPAQDEDDLATPAAWPLNRRQAGVTS